LPSARGEFEITNANWVYLEREYLEPGQLPMALGGQGFSWLDTGTRDRREIAQST
jgi:glucose-1-phosphate thymidylyltransferase